MPPAAALRPGEERHDAARRSVGVAKVEVIGAGIVEVDGQLHEPEAEDLRVEIEIALRVAGDRRDVMKTEDLAHERIITPDLRASNAPEPRPRRTLDQSDPARRRESYRSPIRRARARSV